MMKKLFKELLSSKLMLGTCIVSILILVLGYIGYVKYQDKYTPKYEIIYSDTIEDYEKQIEILNIHKEELDKKNLYYEEDLKKINEEIRIYQELMKNNIDYSHIFDGGADKDLDTICFIYNSRLYVELVVFFHCIVILYVLFTKDFDRAAYSFIYTDKRMPIVKNKMLCAFIATISVALLYLCLFWAFASFMGTRYEYVLILDQNTVLFMPIEKYMLIEYFLQTIYTVCFVFLLLASIALVLKKSSYFLIAILAFALAYYVIGILHLPILPALGLYKDYEQITYLYSWIAKLWIMVPIFLFGFSIKFFLTSDL